MLNISICKFCGKIFKRNELSNCPFCAAPISTQPYSSNQVSTVQSDIGMSSSKSSTQSSINEDLYQLVEAQNRTAHAVRALAITFVAAPVIAILVIGLIAAALNSGETSLIVLSALIGIGISLWTLFASLNELAKSKVPGN